MALDRRFQDQDYILSHGWGKILSHLRKQFDSWALDLFAQKGYKGFKMAYMPVIMNIDKEGTRNNDLASCSKMTKQAMSKIVKELQKKGYVSAKTDPIDKRGVIFTLTKRGNDFLMGARTRVSGLMEEYRQEMGKKNFDDIMNKLITIIEYNDKKLNG